MKPPGNSSSDSDARSLAGVESRVPSARLSLRPDSPGSAAARGKARRQVLGSRRGATVSPAQRTKCPSLHSPQPENQGQNPSVEGQNPSVEGPLKNRRRANSNRRRPNSIRRRPISNRRRSNPKLAKAEFKPPKAEFKPPKGKIHRSEGKSKPSKRCSDGIHLCNPFVRSVLGVHQPRMPYQTSAEAGEQSSPETSHLSGQFGLGGRPFVWWQALR